MSQKRRGISAFNDLCGYAKSPLRISIFSENGISCCQLTLHGSVVPCSILQSRRRMLLPLTPKSIPGLRIAFCQFIFHHHCLFRLHHLPGSFANNGNDLRETNRIEKLFLETFPEYLNLKNISNTRHA